MHDSKPVWVASPSLYETFIHNTLPAFTGARTAEQEFSNCPKRKAAHNP
jgi:hypothetical protein